MASFMRTVSAPATPRSSAVTGFPFLSLGQGGQEGVLILLEQLWRISLYVTDNAIAKLYET